MALQATFAVPVFLLSQVLSYCISFLPSPGDVVGDGGDTAVLWEIYWGYIGIMENVMEAAIRALRGPLASPSRHVRGTAAYGSAPPEAKRVQTAIIATIAPAPPLLRVRDYCYCLGYCY